MEEEHIHGITRVIQLALAPAFLLTALAALLNVFANRLARIVDRHRAREASAPELARLERRAKLVRWAITLATGAALLISLVIGVAFLGFMLGVNTSQIVAVLFIGAMACLTGALVFFLAEVTTAISGVRLREERPK